MGMHALLLFSLRWHEQQNPPRLDPRLLPLRPRCELACKGLGFFPLPIPPPYVQRWSLAKPAFPSLDESVLCPFPARPVPVFLCEARTLPPLW